MAFRAENEEEAQELVNGDDKRTRWIKHGAFGIWPRGRKASMGWRVELTVRSATRRHVLSPHALLKVTSLSNILIFSRRRKPRGTVIT